MQQAQNINKYDLLDSPNFKTLHNFKIKYANNQISKSKYKSEQKKLHQSDSYRNKANKSIQDKIDINQQLEQNQVIIRENSSFPERLKQSFSAQAEKNIFNNKNNKNLQSNLIGKPSKGKVGAIIIDKIQQIRNKQQKFGMKNNIQIQTEKVNSAKNIKTSKIGNTDNNNYDLNKNFMQPFINKKTIHSFQHPNIRFDPQQTQIKFSNSQYEESLNKQLKSLQIGFLKQKSKDNQNSQMINQIIQEMSRINMTYTNHLNSINQYALIQTSILRRNRYKKKKLQPLKLSEAREKMSNNIRDYLSVEKIQIKQMQNQLLSQTSNSSNNRFLDKNNQFDKHVKSVPSSNKVQIKLSAKKNSTVPINLSLVRKKIKFVPPFNLYYYRDFIWKVAFSNQLVIETPFQYQTKIKVYLGKGNNSNLIRGLIHRRPWYQITQKYQDAHFAWTQIKVEGYFALQEKNIKNIQLLNDCNSPLQQKKKQKFNSILNDLENVKFTHYWDKNIQKQLKFKENLKVRSKIMNIKQKNLSQISPVMKIHNHFRNNFVIGNKKALFSLMSKYYCDQGQQVFQYLPLTFHIKNGLQDQQYLKFLQHFYSISKQIKKLQEKQLNSYIYKHNAWIVKPGQNTNRGNGIIVCLSLNQIKSILKKKQKHNDGTNKTYILQKYIQRPLLYKKRKFDFRHYMMMTCTNGIMKGYWYKQGYVRTTSTQYTLKFSSGSVHLTNDAVQKQLPDYGKYEKGNKISYEELNQFIKKNDKNFDFFTLILPKMKKIATDLIKASAKLMDRDRKINNFQVFGLDFMIDEAYNIWLIQCNSNPCLELSCPLLGKIIPKMVQNTFRICLDPIFVPPLSFTPKCQEYYENINELNKYELVYDQRVDYSQKGENVEFLDNKEFQEDDDTFDDDGEAWDD